MEQFKTNVTKTSFGVILKAFFVSSMGTGLSRILGMIRDVAITHFFGASRATDAFWIAYTIPSTFRRFVADEGLTGALIPAISQEETQHGKGAARLLGDTLFTILLSILTVFCVAGIIWAPCLVRIFASGYLKHPDLFKLTVSLTRWLLPFIAMVSFVSFCEGILNCKNHFFIPKIAPGIVSFGVILCIIFFYKVFNPSIYVLVAGFLFGGIIHALIQLIPMHKNWFLPRIRFAINNPRVHFFLREMGKVVLIGLFAQINIIVLRNLSSFLSPGSVTHYQTALRIMDLMQGIIAIGMASAVMPVFAKSVVLKEWNKMRDQLEHSLTVVFFFLFPTAVFLFFFNIPIVSILFCHGNFTYSDTLITASTLQFMIPFLLSVAMINILKKVYFAFDNRNTLLFIGGFGVLLTAGIGGLLIKKLGVSGLAIALSISTFIQLLLYAFRLNKKISDIIQYRKILTSWVKVVIACIPFSIFLFFCVGFGKWEYGIGSLLNIGIFVCSFLFSVSSFIFASYYLKISELQIILELFNKIKKG
jgi:putative peptidoglycan lipid II flippase